MMTNSTTNGTAIMQNSLEQRLSDLAKSKSRLELINRLLISLSSVAGLDNLLQHTLDILMQTIGAANITITFRLNDSWQFRDIYGANRKVCEDDDQTFLSVLADGKPLRISGRGMQVPYPGERGSVVVENWFFPLLSRDRKIGVICMEGMQLTDGSIFEELQPFFIYAGLMLDNEISNYAQLAEAHQRLQESEILYRTLFEQSPDGIMLWDVPALRPLQFNTAAHQQLGYSREEFASLTVADFEASQTPEDIIRVMEKLEKEETTTFETIHRTKTGGRCFMSVTLKMFDIGGRRMILAIHRDVTTLKQAEAALRKSEQYFRELFQNVADPVYFADQQGRLINANRQACRELGYTIDELLALNIADIDAESDSPEKLQAALSRISETSAARFETVHLRKDGSRFPVELHVRSSVIDDQPAFIGVARNLSERKRFEEELRETQELFDLFMRYTPVYTFIKEIDGGRVRVLQISDNFIDMIGRPARESRGHTMEELFPADFAHKITDDDINLVRAGTVFQQEEELNGRSYITIKFPIIREGRNDLIAGFTIDITDTKRAEQEREHLEKQLLHAQKLESLGVLAGGIAHDFNNILMAIIGNADLALMRVSKESPAVDNLHRIEQSAARAADLAKQMLAYSGKGKFVIENLDLNRLLEEMLHMLEVSISKKAVLRFNLHQPLPTVEADATQMRQIIMNLVINASEAIGDRSGVIAITTGCMDCDRSYLKDVWLDENLNDGLYVYLEIADSGCGMDKDTLAKLFDPFFTTKFTGRGLGMAAVLGIVRGHKGAIKVYSEPAKGTTFKLLLPAGNRPAELSSSTSRTDSWQGSGTVLLVDDEETVRDIGSEMLKELGFSVITANDGREAVALYKKTPDFAFVILDLTMPHMDGEQCFRELRQLDPDVKVIMSSGYNEQEVTQKFIGKGLAGFIQKPYTLSALKEVIKRIV